MSRRRLLRAAVIPQVGRRNHQTAFPVFSSALRAKLKSTRCGCNLMSLTSRFRHNVASEFDFIQERNRWQTRLAKDGDSRPIAGVILPLAPSEWDSLVSSFRSTASSGGDDLADWLEDQKGVVTFSPSDTSLPLLHEHFDMDESEGKLVLVRMKEEEQDTEGLRSTSESLAPLADRVMQWGDNEVYKVVLPENSSLEVEEAVLSYLLHCYSFERYKSNNGESRKGKQGAKVAFPSSFVRKETLALARSTYFVRDLISTPAMDLTPEALQRVAEQLVDGHDQIEVETVVGHDLLSYNGSLPAGHGCGMIYAVGAAATRPDHEPRLIQISYRPPQAKSRIALVGKGVTYDTGGLNLKPGASMLNMKKDMGGAAHVLGVFSCLVELEAPIVIDAWIPAVENVLGSASFRLGDILTSVTGQTTEIGNTDAEGRLILGDALALASALDPDLIVDFATLTGAARVAMGTEVVPFFSNRPNLASQLHDAAVAERDPMWQLPIWHGYEERITKSSKVADLRNIPSDAGLGGAITAALYLKQFVGKDQDEQQLPWIHLDLYGMNGTTGVGEAQGLRTMFRFLWSQYC